MLKFQNKLHHTPIPLKVLSFCFWAGRKRLRLFEYILESLHNPDMANCIQWIDKANGVFQFISKNKEKLAEQWGERKGNRKVMTYQKMARALRNYGRTGEITKIRRKLTYQFGAVVLRKLSLACFSGKDGNIDDQFVKAEHECLYYYFLKHECRGAGDQAEGEDD
uniref:Transcription factor Spi-C n=1 Tax=Naja naja TaxID=35670 RepID=A0A8C6Y6M2_NAJNA